MSIAVRESNMSLRNLLKVPKDGLFYFASDKSTSIVATKEIRKVIQGDKKTKGSEVMVTFGKEEFAATIIGVAGEIILFLTLCLNARKPGKVLNGLNSRQSEIFTEFPLKHSFKLLDGI